MQTFETKAFFRGLREFNEGRFFECHDTLEEIWMGTSGRERIFLQGLIQVSVGFYHFGNGNPSGALSQWGKGIDKLSGFGDEFGGVELRALLESVRQWTARAVGQLSGAAAGRVPLETPKIAFTHNSHRREPWQQ